MGWSKIWLMVLRRQADFDLYPRNSLNPQRGHQRSAPFCWMDFLIALLLDNDKSRQEIRPLLGFYLIPALFLVVTRGVVFIHYRRFGITYLSHLQGSRSRNVGNIPRRAQFSSASRRKSEIRQVSTCLGVRGGAVGWGTALQAGRFDSQWCHWNFSLT